MRPSIFVSIASYRDARCSTTLEHLYKNATFPDRVFVGICQQNKEGDVDCVTGISEDFSWKHQVRVKRMDYKEARGPTYARYLCTQMYNGEDFFMQIDSHCLFVKDWDTKAIDMILDVERQGASSKVILSHYPPTYGDYKEDPGPNDPVTHITHCHFNEHGLLTFKGAVFKKPGPHPRRNAFVAAGFIFARGSLLKKVPWDPHLPYVFTGEEMLLSVRFFTHGWDIYTPNKNLVYHAYIREGEPKFWNDHQYDTNRVHKKIKMITGLIPLDPSLLPEFKEDFDRYGIGKERTLKEFYRLVGVEPQTKKVDKPSIEFFCSSDSKFSSISLFCIAMVILFCLLLILFLWIFLR